MAEPDWTKFPIKVTEDGVPVLSEELHWEYRREGGVVHVRAGVANGDELVGYSYVAE